MCCGLTGHFAKAVTLPTESGLPSVLLSTALLPSAILRQMVYHEHIYHEPRLALEGRLRQHGIYPTGQRLAIAAVLLARHQHVTADGLHESLRRAGEQVSKATVYNTLSLFVDKGLVREIVVDSGKSFYDSNNSSHHHIFNADTGEITDILEPLTEQLGNIHVPSGTVVESIDVVVRVRNKSR